MFRIEYILHFSKYFIEFIAELDLYMFLIYARNLTWKIRKLNLNEQSTLTSCTMFVMFIGEFGDVAKTVMFPGFSRS